MLNMDSLLNFRKNSTKNFNLVGWVIRTPIIIWFMVLFYLCFTVKSHRKFQYYQILPKEDEWIFICTLICSFDFLNYIGAILYFYKNKILVTVIHLVNPISLDSRVGEIRGVCGKGTQRGEGFDLTKTEVIFRFTISIALYYAEGHIRGAFELFSLRRYLNIPRSLYTWGMRQDYKNYCKNFRRKAVLLSMAKLSMDFCQVRWVNKALQV